MARIALRALVAVVLIAVGWSVGHAQGSPPTFNLAIDAPIGDTSIQCKRGCELFFLRDGSPTASNHFTLSCKGDGETRRCSGTLSGGIVTPPLPK